MREIRALGGAETSGRAVIELHLIGYTDGGDHLVFDLEADGEGRYLVTVEPDLLATLEAIRRERIATGKPVDARPRAQVTSEGPGSRSAPGGPAPDLRRGPSEVPGGTKAPVHPSATADDGHTTDVAHAGAGPEAARVPASRRSRAAESSRPQPARDVAPTAGHGGGTGTREDGAGTGAPEGGTHGTGQVDGASGATAAVDSARSRLSPAEIQAQLRAGRSVRSVAREAGADPAWVERWNVPIVAERERMLDDARSRRLDQPRAKPLGVAVDRSLAERGVAPEDVDWRVTRREDGRWRVSVRFTQDDRERTATWLLDPDADRLRAQSPLATELSAPGRAASGRS